MTVLLRAAKIQISVIIQILRFSSDTNLMDHLSVCFRYMNISDQWETPEKQPFKDFVRTSASVV